MNAVDNSVLPTHRDRVAESGEKTSAIFPYFSASKDGGSRELPCLATMIAFG